MRRRSSRMRTRFGLVVPLIAVILLVTAVWTWWAESHPHTERELRVLVQEQLQQWFPEEMQAHAGQYGLFPRSAEPAAGGGPRVLLVHGLDEPGNIWDELAPELEGAGFDVWEFRYPNDQAIDRSADLLAEHWPEFESNRPLVLVGHSMGGLVVRDFVSRWRHPEGAAAAIGGPAVRGVVLAGTPNQGSDWARLRAWLELRELFGADPYRRFSLFAGLRDGTGAAKIDLRPGSAFLEEINGRAWPKDVPVRIIGGILLQPPPAMMASVEAIRDELASDDLAQALQAWWSDVGEGLGDGVVPVASLAIAGAPPPILVSASHRGMLTRLFAGDDDPPAIATIVEIVSGWMSATDPPAAAASAFRAR
jgi:pimeloyl-ACP methyl ester carboxylesterase